MRFALIHKYTGAKFEFAFDPTGMSNVEAVSAFEENLQDILEQTGASRSDFTIDKTRGE